MDAKHTPGPWFGDGEPVSYTNDAMILIYREDGTEIGFAYSREDAAMFAAAPDMLAALQAIEPFLPIGFAATGRAGASETRNDALSSARESVRAAIARATT